MASKQNKPAAPTPQFPATQAAQLPANWQEEMAREAREAAAAEPVQSRFISLKGGIMSFNGSPFEGNKANVIVLDSVIEQQYFPNAYDPNAPATPECYAFGRDAATMKPHDLAPVKQSPRCPSCPQNQWGSNGKGKACKEVRRLLVIDASLLEKGPEAVLAGEPAMLKVPVMSVRNWSTYVTQIAAKIKRPPYATITEISCHPDPRSMFQVKFAFIDVVSTELLGAVGARRQLAVDAIMAPYPSGGSAPQPQQSPEQARESREATAARQAGRKF